MRADVRQNRAALVDAGWRMIADKGPEVSLRSVAAEAGVGIATLYRHFPTREDLVTGVVKEMVDRILAVFDEHADGWGTAQDAEQTWHAIAHGVADLRVGEVALATIAVVPEGGKVWTETSDDRARLAVAYGQLLDTAASYGLVSEDLTAWSFHLGLAALSRPLAERAEEFAPDQAGWMVDVFLRGLRP
jgi:AcrR family transcriptional regulator